MNEILKIKNLSCVVPRSDKVIFQNINFQINQGDIIQLTGDNGTGKSTLLKLIMRFDNGLKVSGEIIYKKHTSILLSNINDIQSYRRNVIYIPQNDNYEGLNNITVLDHFIDSGRALGLNVTIDDILTFMIDYGYEEMRVKGKNNFNLKTPLSRLSGGQARVITILTALFMRKNIELIVIDEPFNNLDIKNIILVNNFLNKLRIINPSISMLITSHYKLFTFINKELILTNEGIVKKDIANDKGLTFNEVDENSYYII